MFARLKNKVYISLADGCTMNGHGSEANISKRTWFTKNKNVDPDLVCTQEILYKIVTSDHVINSLSTK